MPEPAPARAAPRQTATPVRPNTCAAVAGRRRHGAREPRTLLHRGVGAPTVGISLSDRPPDRACARRSNEGDGPGLSAPWRLGVGQTGNPVGRIKRCDGLTHAERQTAAGSNSGSPAPPRVAPTPGDTRGDTNVSETRTTPRGSAKSRSPERGTRGMYSACPSSEKSTDLQVLLMPEEGLEPPTRGL
jgi:hypothetical protein